MGVATGCGFKEIYRFPHTTYPYSSCICTFLQQHPYFFVHLKKICFSFFRVYSTIHYNTCTAQIIIESVDSISRDEQDVPLTQYITNA